MKKNRKIRYQAKKPVRIPDTPGDFRTVFASAARHHQSGQIHEAVTGYERALFLNPGFADAYNNLGVAFVQLGRIDEARAHFERAIALNPGYADAHNNLGNSLAAQGRLADAAAHFERACALDPTLVNAHNNLGTALVLLGRIDEAAAHYGRMLALDPSHAEAHHSLANIFKMQGKFEAALAHYERAIAIRPAYAEAHFCRTEIKTYHPDDPELTTLEALATRDNLPADKAPFIHFGLAKALEDCGDYTRAFEHLRKGNDLKRRQIHYDESAVDKFFARIQKVFDAGVFGRFQGEGDPSSAPIFVLGMPRSGSTLVEQILASHPQVHGAGELADLDIAVKGVLNSGDRPGPYPECVPALDGAALRSMGEAYIGRLPAVANGKIRIVDKSPSNYLNIGLIRLILPNARIIHTTRDPIDTCVSCYSKLFASGQTFSYDLAELGRHYRRYAELMAHWRSVLPSGTMLEMSYEDMVDDPAGQARRLIDYCGLPWDDRCLSFYKESRPVNTASAVQVRQPVFRSSLQRWRRYESGIGPLLNELGDIISSSPSLSLRGQNTGTAEAKAIAKAKAAA